MKSDIVFFDTFENSKKGTYRGTVIFPLLILLNFIYYNLTKKYYDKHIDNTSLSRRIASIFISGFLVVSALGIHNPDTVKKAIVFGGLVGLVIYGTNNATLLYTSKKWNYTIAVLDIVWGVISTAFLAFVLYKAVGEYPGVLTPI